MSITFFPSIFPAKLNLWLTLEVEIDKLQLAAFFTGLILM